jgi:hypothetical protein
VEVEALAAARRPEAFTVNEDVEADMRTRFLAVGVAALAGAGLLFSGPVLAGVGLGSTLELRADEKTKAALIQVREAIAAGEAGQVMGLRWYALQALGLTRSVIADPRMTEAARHLERAMTAAREGDTSAGLAHAREAERELEAAG